MRTNWKEALALFILAVGAVPAPAYLIGWLSANGQTSAMTMMLGLIGGLLAYFGLKPPASAGGPARIEAAIVDASASPLSALIGTLAVWGLCLAWIYGFTVGKRPVATEFPPLSAVLTELPQGSSPLKASLATRLVWLRITMQSKGYGPEEYVSFIRDVVVPLIQSGQQTEAEGHVDWLTSLLEAKASPAPRAATTTTSAPAATKAATPPAKPDPPASSTPATDAPKPVPLKVE